MHRDISINSEGLLKSTQMQTRAFSLPVPYAYYYEFKSCDTTYTV